MDEIRKRYNQYRLYHIGAYTFVNIVYFVLGYMVYIGRTPPVLSPNAELVFYLLSGAAAINFLFSIYIRKTLFNSLDKSDNFQDRFHRILPVGILMSVCGHTFSVFGLLLFILGYTLWHSWIFLGAGIVSQVFFFIRWDKWLELVSPDRS